MSKLVDKVTVWDLFALALLAIPAAVHAQLPVSPRRFVDFLDTRCYEIPNQPPLNFPLRLDHLNPLFVQMGLPFENVVLTQPQSLCVPVSKNDLVAPPDTLPFIRFVDWKCYGITGPLLGLQLTLTQLNPVIAKMFGSTLSVTLQDPTQLCVPVEKNQQAPPRSVAQYISFSDVLCYPATGNPLDMNLTLTHLDPLLIAKGLPPENVFVGNSQSLCVPVAKNGVFPPGIQ